MVKDESGAAWKFADGSHITLPPSGRMVAYEDGAASIGDARWKFADGSYHTPCSLAPSSLGFSSITASSSGMKFA
jgi:hypothetical protein